LSIEKPPTFSGAKNFLGAFKRKRKPIFEATRKNVIFPFQCRVTDNFDPTALDTKFQIFKASTKFFFRKQNKKSINELSFPKSHKKKHQRNSFSKKKGI
jgi:hypothetical protein